MVGRCGADSVIIAVTMRRKGREGERQTQKTNEWEIRCEVIAQ